MITPEVVWLSLGILLLLVEVTTGGFWVGFFGLGAIVTGLLVWFGLVATLNAQLTTFVLASVLPLILFRRSLVRWLNRDKPIMPIGDAAGQTAVVVSEIGPGAMGRVEFQGSTWDAESLAGEQLAPGARVRIVRQDGTRLFVRSAS
jgi:membrane protein implicated in regulation of membrane protease activity